MRGIAEAPPIRHVRHGHVQTSRLQLTGRTLEPKVANGGAERGLASVIELVELADGDADVPRRLDGGHLPVRQPFVQMGEVAYQLLSDQIDGRDSASIRVELAATLVVRESTALPRTP